VYDGILKKMDFYTNLQLQDVTVVERIYDKDGKVMVNKKYCEYAWIRGHAVKSIKP
jgi:small nuclear ribonucleoprotein (snRNP)-like protein